jgi:hypothetical protein
VRRLSAFLAPALLLLAGCVEVREVWRLQSDGSGTYALTVRWDADLWNRIGDVVGPEALRQFEGRAFPLDARAWREGLEGLEGLTIKTLEERDAEGGKREITLVLDFRRIEDLLAWEVLSRRTIRVRFGSDGLASWEMTPLARVPVLDALADASDAREAAPERALGSDAPLDPPPLRRLGVLPEHEDLAAKMLAPALGKVRFTFRFEVPGRARRIGARTLDGDEAGAEQEIDFAGLKGGADRSVRFAWLPLALDTLPLVDHEGDRDPRAPAR